MTGYISLLLLAGLALAGLRLLGMRGALLTMAAAGLMFGAAGYAVQGRPGLSGSPARGLAQSSHVPLAKARHALIGQFTGSERWLILADSYAARGKTEDAVGLVQSGLRAHPDDFTLWIGLGNALTDHAGILTPAAELAFARAAKLAPWSPAPPFFHGLAQLRSGQRDAALVEWKALLAAAPAEAGWRPLVEDGVAMLERGQAGS
jgi:cytochrome c-type biogenesis protein CcmH/NrfG